MLKGFLPYDINNDATMHADEWKNFLARIGRDENAQESELADSLSDILELRFWASYRGQTLARTGRCFHHVNFLFTLERFSSLYKFIVLVHNYFLC